jgi:hypothetical protein
MTNFNELFGGLTIDPAQLSYVSYTINANLALTWPMNAPPGSNPAASKIDVFAQSTNLQVALPDATQVSVGQDVLFRNTGANTYMVTDNAGNVIGTVASGQAWYFWLLINTSAAGVWAGVQFGAGVSNANAAALAGAGLQAIVTQLNQSLQTVTLISNYSPGPADRAKVLLEEGGATVFTPAAPATLGNGWFVYVINQGTGTLTWTPSGGALIDNNATKILNPTESAVIFSDGTNFWSLGYGRAVVSTVTGTTINMTGAATPFPLSSIQIAAQVQDYSGLLVNNVMVQLGTGVGYWFVRNNTSGAFSLSFQTNGSDPGVSVPQGSFSILRSNGSNVAVAFSGAVGTVTSINFSANFAGGPFTLTTTGSVELSNPGVTAGTYGSNAAVPVITVDAFGRLTTVTTAALGTSAPVNKSAGVGLADASLMLQLDANGLVPSINGGDQPGDIKYSIASSKPGWVLSNGLTIGNAASVATLRAAADTVNLFTALWNNYANAQATVSGGRGASAAADFAANKTITVPDLRGVVLAGMDTLGTSANANRLSSLFASSTPGAQLSNNGTTSTTYSGSATVSGTVTVNSGGVSVTVGGSVTAASVGLAAPGGVIFAAGIGDGVTASGSTAAITSNGGNTLGGTSSGTTASFGIVQSTLVMNVFVKL